tara:strand:+ start:126 stop:431 length:306 start_codon:yes stop_codon:yes gene_type:complete
MKFKSLFRKNIIVLLVGFYFAFSVLLKLFLGVDYLIPCLWKTGFGFVCHGCGITSSFIEIIKGDFLLAWEINKFTFFVVPLILFYSVKQVFLNISTLKFKR